MKHHRLGLDPPVYRVPLVVKLYCLGLLLLILFAWLPP